MKKFGRSIMLLGLLALLLPCGSGQAAGGSAMLANLHKARQIGCAECHGPVKKITVDDSEKGVNQSCVRCHGTLDAMAAKVKGQINPHKSHLGQINCTTCHSGHTTSQAYCLKCHSYTMPIPGGATGSAAPITSLKAKKPTKKLIVTTDVVVIGSGAAGMTAAITAHDAGAQVILLEKQPITGGNSMLAAGGMNAAETPFQSAKGIKDSVELMYQDTMKGGKNINDPALVRILAQNSAGSVAWLTSLGADISDVGRMGGASADRAHRPAGGYAVGAHIINVLRNNAAVRKIDIRVNSKVIEITEDSKGRVTGVVVEGKHSGRYTIKAKAVVLTTGGFSANPERVAYYRPEFKGMATSNQPGATGDGIDLGAKAGGELKDMKEIQIHPTVAAGSRILITEAVRGNGAILVNQEGKRFVNELTTRDKASELILNQTGKSAYLVFDEGIRKSLKQIDGYFHLELVKEGATLKELAAALKMPAETLEGTIGTYNKAVETKNDAEFKRPDMPRALRTAKYYAIEVKPGVHYTMGGLKTTTDAQVMSRDGKLIVGFFAAGEVTGGVHGANRLGGNSISQTITFGRIAGSNAAQLVKAATGK